MMSKEKKIEELEKRIEKLEKESILPYPYNPVEPVPPVPPTPPVWPEIRPQRYIGLDSECAHNGCHHERNPVCNLYCPHCSAVMM